VTRQWLRSAVSDSITEAWSAVLNTSYLLL